jgi:D-cysteine desulfhydrase family pyridoxal phosphate-dependent enzyme
MPRPLFPRVQLIPHPTPLEPLERLSGHLGGPAIYVKRDDLTGLGGGGNKVRKLEYLVADAIEQGADTLVTIGGVQSNHVRQTAAAAAKIGLSCVVILEDAVERKHPEYLFSGNVLLDRMFGAEIHRLERGEPTDDAIATILSAISHRGNKPYFIPVGGSTALGALGYVTAAGEMARQLDDHEMENATIVLPTGSAGTHAGLLAGFAELGRFEEVIGIAVSADQVTKENLVHTLVKETLSLLSSVHEIDPLRIRVEDRYVGPGYGLPTDKMLEAVQLTARLEGLLLDPVYTGKAMAGLIDLVVRGELTTKDNIIFLHTGGSPALFAYPDLF